MRQWLDQIVRCWHPLILGFIAILVVATFRDYGITTDEAVQSEYGELVIDYFLSGRTDQRCNQFLDLKFYGPLFESFLAIVYRWTPQYQWEIRHLLTALTGLLTIPAVVWFCRSLGDGSGRIGFFAVLGLIAQPQFYGHWYNNSKDIPLACFFAWSMAAISNGFSNSAGSLSKRVAQMGFTVGLTLTIRPAAYLLLGGMLILAYWSVWIFQAKKSGKTETNFISAGHMAAILGIAWIVMTTPWPWAWENPLIHPAQAMALATQFHTAYPVLYRGELGWSNQLPRTYLIQTVLMTAPFLLLMVAGVGLAVSVKKTVQSTPRLLLIAWFLGPILAWTITRSNIYDGMRHFLFILPALAILFGVGANALINLGKTWASRSALACFAVCCGLAVVPDMARLHPYQMTYHNALVGGLKGADGRFDLDYWRSSYKEAMEWINQRPSSRPDGSVRVLVSADPKSRVCAEAYRATHVQIEVVREHRQGSIPQEFDYYLATIRANLQIGQNPQELQPYLPAQSYPDSPIVHRVCRDGAVFSVIRGKLVQGLQAP